MPGRGGEEEWGGCRARMAWGRAGAWACTMCQAGRLEEGRNTCWNTVETTMGAANLELEARSAHGNAGVRSEVSPVLAGAARAKADKVVAEAWSGRGKFFAESKLTTKRAYPLWIRLHCASGLRGNRFPRYRARVEGLERK